MTRAAAARRMVECCRQLAARGLIAGQDGNVSVRVGRDVVLVTPAGRMKGELRPQDMVAVDLAGRTRDHRRKPTSELDLHLRILRRRPDVGAVVHAHPPAATGFAVAGEELEKFVLPELIFLVGRVPVVPYGTPGTAELGDRLEPFLDGADAFLLANHGAVTVGATLDAAWIRMETLEHAARIILCARLLGRVNTLDPAAVATVTRLRERTLRETDA